MTPEIGIEHWREAQRRRERAFLALMAALLAGIAMLGVVASC